MGNLDKEETKKVMKEAIKEWMDARFSDFGKWTLAGIAGAAFVALMYFIIKLNGFAIGVNR